MTYKMMTLEEKFKVIETDNAPETRGALFLAFRTTVNDGKKVAVVMLDYFANRKPVIFLGGKVVPIALNYMGDQPEKGIGLNQSEDALKNGVKGFVFSNPNNPTGPIFSKSAIIKIAASGQIVKMVKIYSV